MGIMTTTPIELTTNIAGVPGVAPDAEEFRRLGLRSVADLVRCLPLRYEHELADQPIAEVLRRASAARGDDLNAAVSGEVETVRSVRARKRRVEAAVTDATGRLAVTWFNMPWLEERLRPGMAVRLTGRVRRRGPHLQMVNPRLETIDPLVPLPPRQERLRPIYPASDAVPSARIEAAVQAILDQALPRIEDHLHEAYRAARALPSLADAYRMIHRPVSSDEHAAARRRLALDDLLLLELGVMLKRRHRRQALRAVALRRTGAIDAHITARFGFDLTPGQRAVIDEIAADLASPTPMNRLLQGDVGAGKTVVALYGMLMAVASRHQAAIMAPTELLAEQHADSIAAMLKGGRVSIELLTGSITPARRRDVLSRLESGEIDLLIGTHALLTETVRFSSLAFVVIDEQHRFGGHQRATLRTKGNDDATVPHVLVMTATPIPRTLSLTIFGDLDVSTIRGLPPGRAPVVTKVLDAAKAGEVYPQVARRLAAGEQAYIVVPVIDESDLGLTDVHSHLEKLSRGPLAGLRLAALHGRLDRDERDAIMTAFRRGGVDALVATTVIEVGADVPNASIMVIEHAERFGLAQLHQLRGRIGRASRESLCFLLADATNPDAEARLRAIASTSDGFAIAERDLEIRGPGELFGARQSGMPPFHAAELPRDLDLLLVARRDAIQWIEENPALAGPRDALLKQRLLKTHGAALGLGDVA